MPFAKKAVQTERRLRLNSILDDGDMIVENSSLL